jgi:hypothetical protein
MRIKRFQVIEVPVPSGSTLTFFSIPDQPQLRNAKIQGIQVYTPTAITKTPLSGATPVTLADLKQSFLTLYQGDLQIIYRLCSKYNIYKFTKIYLSSSFQVK